MSKSVAKIVNSLVDIVTLPLNKRQRGKAKAHVANHIMSGNYDVVETARGSLKLYGGRGSTIASTVANWNTDEPETRKWIEDFVKSGDLLWDIGANVGIFSIYAAMLDGVEVVGFEPSSLNFALLTEHLALNDMGSKIKALPVALSDHNGIETLYFKSSEQGAACNGLGEARTQFDHYEPQFQHDVPCYTVDGFIKQFNMKTPDHLKLDVDGIEALILKGAPETLKKIKSLIVELEGQNENNTAIEKMLSEAGLVQDHALDSLGDGRNKLYVRQ